MDILIKGMEMPRFCADCPFRETRYDPGYYQYEKCKASGRIFNECRFDVNTFAERLNDCPLVEIKTPHGGLIDRSVLFEEYQNLCNGLLCRDCPFFNERNSCNIEEWILNQPPILEAEE